MNKIFGGVTVKVPFMFENARLGFAYIPYQEYRDLYDLKEGLKRGTIFRELDIPYKEYASNPIMNPFK